MKIHLGGNNKPLEDVKEIELTHDKETYYFRIILNDGTIKRLSIYSVTKIEN